MHLLKSFPLSSTSGGDGCNQFTNSLLLSSSHLLLGVFLKDNGRGELTNTTPDSHEGPLRTFKEAFCLCRGGLDGWASGLTLGRPSGASRHPPSLFHLPSEFSGGHTSGPCPRRHALGRGRKGGVREGSYSSHSMPSSFPAIAPLYRGQE